MTVYDRDEGKYVPKRRLYSTCSKENIADVFIRTSRVKPVLVIVGTSSEKAEIETVEGRRH